jgi:hypothetical protein
MNLHDTLGTSHLSEGIEENRLVGGGSMTVSVWGTQGIQWF